MPYRAVLTLSFAFSYWFTPALLAADSKDAQQLLTLTKTEIGLCLHLGCGTQQRPALTAELAQGSRMLVHGIAIDEASLQRARTTIANAGVAGQAMVERALLMPLPYLNDLANVVVVEDLTALKALGLTEEEMWRVIAPGGALCVRNGDRWESKIKPRPAGMDEWTHLRHAADGNLVSTDSVLSWPFGLRWIDGVPISLGNVGGTRATVTANGRCFALTINVAGNVANPSGPGRDNPSYAEYVVARDAFNGLPLWTFKTGTSHDAMSLGWTSTCSLATDGVTVYTHHENSAVALDAATGALRWRTQCQQPLITDLALLEGVVVVGSWENRVRISQTNFHWAPKSDVGSLEAFDAKSGERKWSLPLLTSCILLSDGVVYAQQQSGFPVQDRSIIALDLQTGKERWRLKKEDLGGSVDFALYCGAVGYAVVINAKAKECLVLSAKDGSVIFRTPERANWTPVVDGLLWTGGKKYDPLTGVAKGKMPTWLYHNACSPSKITPQFIIHFSQFLERAAFDEKGGKKPEPLNFLALRAPCVEGMMVANGMFYAAQTNCKCVPGSICGVVAMGPSGAWPTAADFQQPRPLEKTAVTGPMDRQPSTAEDWPMFRANNARSAASTTQIPTQVRELWRIQAVPAQKTPLAMAWEARLRSPVSPPVCAAGVLYVARSDYGQIAAFDAELGTSKWTFQAGSRIDTSPTLYRGLCLFGCNDGWLYALRAADGQLLWRTRVAPWERRTVVCGQVESVWPAIGSVLVENDVVYAIAGRSSESDGGLALAAFNALDGSMLYGNLIPPGPEQLLDVLTLRDNALIWHYLTLDPKTGAILEPKAWPKEKPDYKNTRGPIIDGTWTMMWNKRSLNAFKVDEIMANMMAWNDQLIVSNKNAVKRASKEQLWNVANVRVEQVEAIALSATVAVVAGRIKGTKDKPASGFLRLISLTDGKPVCEIPLETLPSYDGVALAYGKIFVSLQNGTLVCFGK